MSNQEYTTVEMDSEEIGVVAGVVQMGKDRQPMEDTFTPLVITRYERAPFGNLVAAEAFYMPPIEEPSVYKWLARELRTIADGLEKDAQERR